ncbi:MAG: PAS domain S-box protein [Chloroflexota bacterium]
MEIVAGNIGISLDRKRSEQILREREEQFRLIFERAPIGMVTAALDGRFLQVNQAFCDMVGYTADELAKLTFPEITHPDDLGYNLQQYNSLIRGGPDYELEKRYIKKDGSIINIIINVANVLDDEGQPLYVMAQIIDITERKRTELALQESEAQFRHTFESAPTGITIASLDGRFLRINQAYCDMLEYTTEELLGRPFKDVTHPDDIEADLELVHKTLRGEISNFQMEKRYIAKSGRLVYVLLQVTLVRDTLNQPSHFIAQVVDITNRKQAEAERMRFTNQLHTAAEVSEQISAILDPDLLLHEVVTLLQERFNLYHIHVYLLDEETTNLVLRAGSGQIGQRLLELGHKIPLDYKRSLVARAARSREIIAIDDVKIEPDFMPNPLLPETQTEVAVPLIVGDKVLGVFNVQDSQPYRFNQTDLNVFSSLAGHIATALANADLFRTQKQAEAALITQETRLRSLYEITTGSDLDDNQQFYQALETGATLLGMEIGIISQIEEEMYTILHCYTSQAAVEAGQTFELGQTFCSLTILSDEVLSFENAKLSEFKNHPCYKESGLEAYIGIALNVEGQYFGTLNFSSTHPRETPFTQADHNFVRLMAEWVCTTIERQYSQARLIRARDQALEASRLKSELLAKVSHELRTPLGSILGYTELMEKGIYGPLIDKQTAITRKVINSTNYLTEMFNEILDQAHL